jgi:hypothetical protein
MAQQAFTDDLSGRHIERGESVVVPWKIKAQG